MVTDPPLPSGGESYHCRDTVPRMGTREADDPRKRTMCVRLTDAEWNELNEWVGNRNRSNVFRRILLDAARADED